MRLIFLLFVVFDLLFLFGVLPNAIAEYRLTQSRETATVEIVKLPNCASASLRKSMKIRYEDQVYVLRVACSNANSLRKGQTVEMLHKPGTSIFLFQTENKLPELEGAIVLVLLYSFCLAKLFKIFFRS